MFDHVHVCCEIHAIGDIQQIAWSNDNIQSRIESHRDSLYVAKSAVIYTVMHYQHLHYLVVSYQSDNISTSDVTKLVKIRIRRMPVEAFIL